MKIIDKEETTAWLSRNALLDSDGRLVLSEFLGPIVFATPTDSGKKTALSKEIAHFFDVNDESMLWIDEFGIWPSAEDWNLFNGFRKSLGENKPLFEKPGHIFTNQDLCSARSLIAMVLYFCCGAYIISAAKNIVIRISHDEMIDIYAKDKNTLHDINDLFTKYLGPAHRNKVL